MKKIIGKNEIIKYLVVFGSTGFISFYILAAINYPGGSDFEAYSTGFSLTENYWCELLGAYAKNGSPNHGKPYALISLGFLNLTLACTWIYFGYHKTLNHQPNYPMMATGTLSTLCVNFISTDAHDYFIGLSVLFGVLSILQLLNKQRHISHFLYVFGLLGIFLITLNCLMYFFDIEIFLLPLIQKITFIFMLTWFILNVSIL